MRLAPLEPNEFLRWAFFAQSADMRRRGASPLTLVDLHYEFGGDYPLEQLRKDFICLASRVRRNQRLGLDPWEGT